MIYNFLALCLAYVGGPGSVEVKMNGYILAPSWKYTTCCLPPIAVSPLLSLPALHSNGFGPGFSGFPAPCSHSHSAEDALTAAEL